MADRGDTHYPVPSLNLWFALSSVALLVATVWMVLHDFNRPWKEYQRTFREMEIQRGQEALAAPDAVAALEEEERIREEYEAAKAQLEAKGGELKTALEKKHFLDNERSKADAQARMAKEEANWAKFLAEEHRLKHPDDERNEARLQELRELDRIMKEKAAILKDAEMELEKQEAIIAELKGHVNKLESEMKQATRSVELVRKRMNTIAPTDMATKIANIVRDDIPGLDFVGPSLKVLKVLPPDLTFELNFTTKGRIDMCQTCHVPIDREGFEDEEHPFQTHPRLDLFLTAKSPHPLNEFGCTICHRGAGEALDFQRVDHRPENEEMAEEWHEEYHWHKQHYWDYPMLAADYVESGCVQCHQDSLEIIEPDAPKVTEGYQLFERYGCYACHKVEWFPTKRRPGPTLAKINQKTNKEFIDAWINDPKAFRPTTWMPQIFHLENYSPETEVAISEYGKGRVMMGDEWSDTAIAAVATYITDLAASDPLPEIPVEGDALRGKEVFTLSGCLACHNVAPFTEEEAADARFLAEKSNDTNEHGPNLRGVATKTTPEWLYAWIKDPTAYWSETRMPDLRLSDQDAADIVAYVFEDPDGYFHDTPEGWAQGERPYKRDVLEEQARWFYNRTRPVELDADFEGKWADDGALLHDIGEKWVLSQGCHSCHEIPGLENAQPIGTELTTWASKTVDKLDFGFIPDIIARDELGLEIGSKEFAYFKEQYKSYRENFLEQKLHAPRSYDREKVKNPSERLKMPWFDFTDEEVQAIATFVNGLVEDEVELARMKPTPEQLGMDTGLRVLRQKNCAACHVLEPGTIEFTDEEGVHHEVKAQLSTLEEEFFPPPMTNFDAYLDDYVAWMREEVDEEFEVEELYAQLLETDVELGEVGDTIGIANVDSLKVSPPWGGDFVALVNRYYLSPWDYDEETDSDISLTGDPDGEGRVQDVDGEWRDFTEEQYDKVRWTYAPPVLIGEGEKLQRDWFYNFLIDPEPLREQIRVRMPTFNWQPGEAGAVADYFAVKANQEWPKEYARQMLRQLDQTTDEVAAGIAALGLSGSSADQVQGIADGLRVETAAGLPNLMKYGDAQGFEWFPAVDPEYEPILPRTPGGIARFTDDDPEFWTRVHRLATDNAGPTCNQCHFIEGTPPTNEAPVGWAPDLKHTRNRLRPDWVTKWLQAPSKIYPGTTMPANFDATLTQWQELYPAPSAEQIDAVVTWLFNLDVALLQN